MCTNDNSKSRWFFLLKGKLKKWSRVSLIFYRVNMFMFKHLYLFIFVFFNADSLSGIIAVLNLKKREKIVKRD